MESMVVYPRIEVNGERRSCETVATNSDFISSSSLKCVTSRITATTPRVRPSLPLMGATLA